MIEIWAPRWKDRTVLVADWKIQAGRNIIEIVAERKDGSRFYPLPFAADGAWLRSFELTPKRMRVVPLDELQTVESLKMDDDISKCHNAILTKHGECPECLRLKGF